MIQAVKVFILPILCLFCVSTIYADWIGGYYGPDAGVDSLERVAILIDTVPGSDLGVKIVAAGDQNGDGYNDVVCSRRVVWGDINSYGYLFYGGPSVDGLPDFEFPRFTTLFGNIGDINNDSVDDFGGMFLPNLLYDIHLGGQYLSDTPELTFEDKASRTARAGDFDNDGILELAISQDLNTGYVNIYRIDSLRDTIPEYIIPDTSKDFGRNISVNDFNGDGYDDLAVAAYLNRDTSFIKFYFGGNDFDTIADLVFESTEQYFGQQIEPVKDFNNDGFEDYLIIHRGNTRTGIYYGGPLLDNVLDIPINRKSLSSFFDVTDCGDAGDINNDGYNDIIASEVVTVAAHYKVYIYLGGPDADSVVDITFTNYDIDGTNMELGYQVEGIGDFGGDSIDDIAVFAMRDGPEGEVYIIAGWDSRATDIAIDYEPTLPDGFSLKQNYPNPFNPSTTIEFELPARSDVTLTVYNVLGQEVVRLIDEELKAGSYSIEWDGKGTFNRKVATGVYLYRLVSEGFVKQRTMLLLK